MKKWVILLFSIGLVIGSSKAFNHYQKWHVKPDVTVIGCLDMYDGIGRQSLELINVIKDHMKVRFNITRSGRATRVPLKLLWYTWQKCFHFGDIIIYEDHPIKGSTHVRRKMAQVSRPDQVRIAYSMFESTRIPEYWVKDLNDNFDMIIVPSPFLIEAYQNSGITKPLFYLPLGRDLTAFLQKPLKKQRGKILTFGMFGSYINRKNHINTMRAFYRAFGDRSDVHLKIEAGKGSPVLFSCLEKQVSKLGVNNISISYQDTTFDQYVKRYDTIDCLVNFSKGEGFSNQPREAMALGIPVLITNNTAQEQICATGLCVSLDTPIQESAEYPEINVTSGLHFNFSIEEGAKAFQKMAEDYDIYLSQAELMRQWARAFDFQSLRPLYLTIASPQTVVLGEKNEIREGEIETNDAELYRRYCAVLAKRGKRA